MWIAELKLTHDCLIGNRCKKFSIVLQSIVFTNYVQSGKTVTVSMHLMSGQQLSQKKFVEDLKGDSKVLDVEVKGNTFFLVETDDKKPVASFSNKLFFVKPVLIDEKGVEKWEIGSWEEMELKKFVHSIRQNVTLLDFKIIEKPLMGVYFPKIFPGLTSLQKRALELAVRNGYYSVPKRIGMRALAGLMGVSLSNYQKHLKKAEAVIIPDLLSFLH